MLRAIPAEPCGKSIISHQHLQVSAAHGELSRNRERCTTLSVQCGQERLGGSEPETGNGAIWQCKAGSSFTSEIRSCLVMRTSVTS